jgi:hypothetical protein
MGTRQEIRIALHAVVLRLAGARPVRPRRCQTEGAECTAVQVPARAQPKGWRGRDERAGSTGSILPRREQRKVLRGSYYDTVESY